MVGVFDLDLSDLLVEPPVFPLYFGVFFLYQAVFAAALMVGVVTDVLSERRGVVVVGFGVGVVGGVGRVEERSE